MTLLLLLAVIGLCCSWLAAPLFETTMAVALLTPLMWFAVGKLLLATGFSVPTGALAVGLYVVLASLLVGVLYYVIGGRRDRRSVEEYSSFAVFVTLFCFTYYYATSWPDFIAMGERLRDYAILASTISSPVEAVEPWMSGAVLNYYVYWYRFGHFLSTLLRLEVWDVYPLMTAFAMAFYGAAIFEVARVVLGLSIFISAVTSVIATLGSNVAGVVSAYTKDSNWWGPSRVVKGAINEFPAWSFILGDLHPHFLNLGLLPLLLLIAFACCRTRENRPLAYVALFFVAPIGVLWMFAANAWEVPLWAGTLASIAGAGILLNLAGLKRWLRRFSQSHGAVNVVKAFCLFSALMIALMAIAASVSRLSPEILGTALFIVCGGSIVLFPFKRQVVQFFRDNYSIKDPKLVVVVVLGLLICIALKLSGSHIVPEGGQLSRVVSPIPLTRTSEMFLHWGGPLTFLSIGSLLLLPRKSEKLVALALLVGTLLLDEAVAFLIALLGLHLLRLLNGSKRLSDRNACVIFSEGLGLAGLVFLLLPEAFFLNDAYGGENERMNTIFKVYNTAWGILTVAAASLFTRGVMAISSAGSIDDAYARAIRWIGGGIGVGAMGALLLFFFHAATLRLPSKDLLIVEPREEGLSELQQRFPGSVEVIRRLREEKRGVVLEAQGNAYDYTTFISTLSGHSAYLGWANHINLLTKRFFVSQTESVGAEVFKREQTTQSIYSTGSCDEKKRLAGAERISFIVVGTKEKEKYPSSRSTDFSCFEALVIEREFALYRVI